MPAGPGDETPLWDCSSTKDAVVMYGRAKDWKNKKCFFWLYVRYQQRVQQAVSCTGWTWDIASLSNQSAAADRRRPSEWTDHAAINAEGEAVREPAVGRKSLGGVQQEWVRVKTTPLNCCFPPAWPCHRCHLVIGKQTLSWFNVYTSS